MPSQSCNWRIFNYTIGPTACRSRALRRWHVSKCRSTRDLLMTPDDTRSSIGEAPSSVLHAAAALFIYLHGRMVNGPRGATAGSSWIFRRDHGDTIQIVLLPRLLNAQRMGTIRSRVLSVPKLWDHYYLTAQR